MTDLTVIGGGLAGSEAAYQAAQRGLKVRLFEMRPILQTGAHQTNDLAELVCSNSLGSNLPDRASGLLKNETRLLGSMLLECAEEASLPAGGALAVDRERFAQLVEFYFESALGGLPGSFAPSESASDNNKVSHGMILPLR